MSKPQAYARLQSELPEYNGTYTGDVNARYVWVDYNGNPIATRDLYNYDTSQRRKWVAPIVTNQTQLDKADEEEINRFKADQKIHNQFGTKSWGEFGKDMAIGTIASMGLPYVLPYLPSVLGELATPLGIAHAASEDGIKKTINYFQTGKPIAGTYSLIGDIFDLSFPIFEGYNIYKGIRSTVNPYYNLTKELNKNINNSKSYFNTYQENPKIDIVVGDLSEAVNGAKFLEEVPEEFVVRGLKQNYENSLDLAHQRGLSGNYDKMVENYNKYIRNNSIISDSDKKLVETYLTQIQNQGYSTLGPNQLKNIEIMGSLLYSHPYIPFNVIPNSETPFGVYQDLSKIFTQIKNVSEQRSAAAHVRDKNYIDGTDKLLQIPFIKGHENQHLITTPYTRFIVTGNKYFDNLNNTELLARYQQLLNLFGYSKSTKLSPELFEYARKNYHHLLKQIYPNSTPEFTPYLIKNPKNGRYYNVMDNSSLIQNNNMDEFFNIITPDKVESFINWAHQYVYKKGGKLIRKIKK